MLGRLWVSLGLSTRCKRAKSGAPQNRFFGSVKMIERSVIDLERQRGRGCLKYIDVH